MSRTLFAKNTSDGNQPVRMVKSEALLKYSGRSGYTVLDLLIDKVTKSKVHTTPTALGLLVTSINDIEATDSRGWICEVNGREILESTDVYATKGTDEIAWRLLFFV